MIKKSLLLALALSSVSQFLATGAYAAASPANASLTNGQSGEKDYQLQAAVDLARKLARQSKYAVSGEAKIDATGNSKGSTRENLDGVMILGGSEVVPM